MTKGVAWGKNLTSTLARLGQIILVRLNASDKGYSLYRQFIRNPFKNIHRGGQTLLLSRLRLEPLVRLYTSDKGCSLFRQFLGNQFKNIGCGGKTLLLPRLG